MLPEKRFLSRILFCCLLGYMVTIIPFGMGYCIAERIQGNEVSSLLLLTTTLTGILFIALPLLLFVAMILTMSICSIRRKPAPAGLGIAALAYMTYIMALLLLPHIV